MLPRTEECTEKKKIVPALKELEHLSSSFLPLSLQPHFIDQVAPIPFWK